MRGDNVGFDDDYFPIPVNGRVKWITPEDLYIMCQKIPEHYRTDLVWRLFDTLSKKNKRKLYEWIKKRVEEVE